MPIAVRYKFSQDFPMPPNAAYVWCTDFSPQDHALMGNEDAERQVVHLTDTTVILKEVFHTKNGDIEKQKLVHFYPDTLRWVSTHLIGSNKYSQFTYEISAKENGSRLNFTALHIDHGKERLPKEEAEALAKSLCESDLNVWKRLAEAMTKELSKKPTVTVQG